jgi:hypothetical protein
VVGGPVDQPHIHVIFQLSEGAGHDRLAQVEPVRRAGDGALVGDGEEAAQMPQFDGHTHGA